VLCLLLSLLLCWRVQNIVVKKAVVEVTGALSLLELVGFRTVELKGHSYIAIDDAAGINSGMLEKAIKLLLQYQERQIAEEKSRPATFTATALLNPRIISSHTAPQLLTVDLLAACRAATVLCSEPASVTSGSRVRCAGGCGYWGDSTQEDLCSICYKKKYLGATATSSMTGVSSGGPAKCIKQCGLYGSDKFGGMCSQCFAKEAATAAVKRGGKQRWLSVRRQLHAVYLFTLGKQEEQANKGRCYVCSKRLPVPIECRCRRTFCSTHRFPLDHHCSYDAQVRNARMHLTALPASGCS